MSQIVTAGIDIGSGCVKAVLFRGNEWLAKETARIRNRDPFALAAEAYDDVLKSAKVSKDEVAYVASTGDAESLRFATGHFYSMTTHGRGALYLCPEARSVLDIGALNVRAIKVDAGGKVLSYKMTSQCASGSGQFLENISRYLGIAQDEIGTLSLQADKPERVSSVCAVLGETDVINMVSRGISSANIVKGIHESMALRHAKLLKSVGAADGVVMLSGGGALDIGLVAAINEALVREKVELSARSHPDSIYSGAIGAAIWGAYRYHKLNDKASETAAA